MLHMQITEFKYDCFDPILPLLGEKSSKIESGIYYYHADHLGSSSVVTDKNGKFHEHLEFFPYGETWINDRANNENLPYRFTGKELDPETGLYYYGARYYDCRLSRWISRDDRFTDLFGTQTMNLYSYVKNNPIRYIDPDGHMEVEGATISNADKMEMVNGKACLVKPKTRKKVQAEKNAIAEGNSYTDQDQLENDVSMIEDNITSIDNTGKATLNEKGNNFVNNIVGRLNGARLACSAGATNFRNRHTTPEINPFGVGLQPKRLYGSSQLTSINAKGPNDLQAGDVLLVGPTGPSWDDPIHTVTILNPNYKNSGKVLVLEYHQDRVWGSGTVEPVSPDVKLYDFQDLNVGNGWSVWKYGRWK